MTEPTTTLIANRYQIEAEIGRGGFATVYRAYDRNTDRRVALKVIHGSFASEPNFVKRFRQEARAAARLRHPNIVDLYDVGDDGGTLYLAMPLIGEGRTLRDLLRERGRLALEEALPILSQVAAALDHLHGQKPPLVHRDLKPANLLLESDSNSPTVLLSDFGLVRVMQDSEPFTRSGETMGTAAYMAPEQIDPQKWGEATPATDIYALGVLAYEMLTGGPPFGAGMAATTGHLNAAPPDPRECVPDLGDDLADALLRGLAKAPAERYPGARVLVDALRAVAEARTTQAAQAVALADLLARADAAHAAGEWLQVQQCCVQIMQIDAAHPGVMQMMTDATAQLQQQTRAEVRRRKMAEQYERGLAALNDRQWEAAVGILEPLHEADADFRDVRQQLALARAELHCAQRYAEAIAHGEAGRWPDACRAWLDVLRLHPDDREGDSLKRALDAVDALLQDVTRLEQEYQTLSKAHKQASQALTRLKNDHQKSIQAHKQAAQALVDYDALTAAVYGQKWEQVVSLAENLLPRLEHAQGASLWLTQAQEKSALTHKPQKPAAAPAAKTALPERIQTQINEQDDKEMVYVPAGPFLYGDKKEKRTLEAFWIDRTPVTNAEYARFVQATKHKPPQHWKGQTPPKAIADHPVVYVSWADAAAYAGWAGKRLPTEEEWEKAARGTDGRAYPWGEEFDATKCNTQESGIGGTTSVGKYSPAGNSPYDCTDMAGNVWELEGDGHVVRGGSWDYSQDDARCAARRGGYRPGYSYHEYGFRCVSPIGAP